MVDHVVVWGSDSGGSWAGTVSSTGYTSGKSPISFVSGISSSIGGDMSS